MMPDKVTEECLRHFSQRADSLRSNVRQLCMDIRRDATQDLEFQLEMVRLELAFIADWFSKIEQALGVNNAEARE